MFGGPVAFSYCSHFRFNYSCMSTPTSNCHFPPSCFTNDTKCASKHGQQILAVFRISFASRSTSRLLEYSFARLCLLYWLTGVVEDTIMRSRLSRLPWSQAFFWVSLLFSSCICIHLFSLAHERARARMFITMQIPWCWCLLWDCTWKKRQAGSVLSARRKLQVKNKVSPSSDTSVNSTGKLYQHR